MFPWIPFLFGVRKRLSDIEYLSIKEFDGKLVKNEGTLSATGDLATLTASSGKDMYLATAKVNVWINADNFNTQIVQIELKANGTVIETFNASFEASTSLLTGGNVPYTFNIKGVKVAATQIIKLEVISIGANIDANGQLTCIEETTGDSPQV